MSVCIEDWEPLVRKMVHKSRGGMELDDAMQVGRLAAWLALTSEAFDAAKASLTTYVATSVLRAVRRAKWVRIGIHHNAGPEAARLQAAEERAGRQLDGDELAAMGLTERRAARRRQWLGHSVVGGEAYDLAVGTCREEDGRFEAFETRSDIDAAIRWLRTKDERMATIVQRRADGETLQVIGDEFGITRERVRQIRDRGIRMLRGWAKRGRS